MRNMIYKISERLFDASERLPKCLNAIAWALDWVCGQLNALVEVIETPCDSIGE